MRKRPGATSVLKDGEVVGVMLMVLTSAPGSLILQNLNQPSKGYSDRHAYLSDVIEVFYKINTYH